LELAFSTSEPDFSATLCRAQLWFRKSRANKKARKINGPPARTRKFLLHRRVCPLRCGIDAYLLRRRAFALFLLTIAPALLRQSVSCCPAARSSCARRMIGLGPPDWLSADSSRSFGWRGLGRASSVLSFARVAVDLFPGRGGQRKRLPRMGIVFSWFDRSAV
jgi:hypothetical protein